MRTLLGLLALACVFTITLAQEEYQIVPEALGAAPPRAPGRPRHAVAIYVCHVLTQRPL